MAITLTFTPVAPPASDTAIVFEGDSHMVGATATNPGTGSNYIGYTDAVSRAIQRCISIPAFYREATSGDTIGNMAGSGNIATINGLLTGSGKNNKVVALQGYSNSCKFDSPAMIKSSLNTFIAGIRATHPTAKIIVCTPPPRSDDTPVMYGTYQEANHYVRGLATVDAVVDLAADGRFCVPGGANYVGDGVHLNDAGNQIFGDMLHKALAGLGLVDGTAITLDISPASFTLTDQTGAAVSTVYETSTTVAGVGSSVMVYATGAGSQTKVGAGGTYSTALKSAVNGDAVFVRNTSWAGGFTPVDSVLTIGDKQDIFTITTGAGPAVPDAFFIEPEVVGTAGTVSNGGLTYTSADAVNYTQVKHTVSDGDIFIVTVVTSPQYIGFIGFCNELIGTPYPGLDIHSIAYNFNHPSAPNIQYNNISSANVISAVAGNTIAMIYKGGKVWVTKDGTAYYGSGGLTAYTAANVTAGVGGFAVTLPAAAKPFAGNTLGGSHGHVWTINHTWPGGWGTQPTGTTVVS